MPFDIGKPVLLITGASGNLGRSLVAAFEDAFQIVGLDRNEVEGLGFPIIEADFSSDEAVSKAMKTVRERFGTRIAAVIHLIAFFDSTGEENPLYQTVNVEGTRRLIHGLRDFEVDRFVYASTMLVHAPCKPGESIDESQPFGPLYVYPQSKLAAEEVVRAEHGEMPYAILRFAGVYDEEIVVPTLAEQIARIYERDFESYFYSASTRVGQAMLHRDDMVDAVQRTVARRKELPDDAEMLIGETEGLGYDILQDEIGYLVHGQDDWPTLRLPKAVAAAGAWAQAKLEPVVPDALDQGEEPFIRPYMVAMSDAHYSLNTSRAQRLLGWQPKHRLKNVLPAIIAGLKDNPVGWYEANGMTAPPAVADAAQEADDGEDLRVRNEVIYRAEHANNRWPHFLNMALGTWLMAQAPLIGLTEPWLRWTEFGLGVTLIFFAALSLSWQMNFARWVCAVIGALVMAAPFLFWTKSPTAYLSDTLVGGLIFGFAIATKPEAGPSPLARVTGPDTPPGWSYNPSAWTQRVPIVALALVGLYVSRYLAGYQLGHVDSVWEPFFVGSTTDPRNGTEEIITSSVSKAWPVSDAALGGYTYMLEILTGIVGSRARWRTMPWLVLLFGLMIVPLGIVSITFVIIQPLIIGTWSTLALIGAAAMLLQIPYSLDEILAVLQFLRRRVEAGKSLLRVFLFGDTDEGEQATPYDEFDRAPGAIAAEMIQGGVMLPWTLWLAALIGASLLFTRVTFGAEGTMADADHLIGALVLTVLSITAAEVARPLRLLLIPLGIALLITPFVYDAERLHVMASICAGFALIVLSIPRGNIRGQYGRWNRYIV